MKHAAPVARTRIVHPRRPSVARFNMTRPPAPGRRCLALEVRRTQGSLSNCFVAVPRPKSDAGLAVAALETIAEPLLRDVPGTIILGPLPEFLVASGGDRTRCSHQACHPPRPSGADAAERLAGSLDDRARAGGQELATRRRASVRRGQRRTASRAER